MRNTLSVSRDHAHARCNLDEDLPARSTKRALFARPFFARRPTKPLPVFLRLQLRSPSPPFQQAMET